MYSRRPWGRGAAHATIRPNVRPAGAMHSHMHPRARLDHVHANFRPRNPFFMSPQPYGPPLGCTPGGPRHTHGEPWGSPGSLRFQGRPPPPHHRQDLAENGGFLNQGRGHGRGGRGMKRRPSGQQPFPAKKRKKESKEVEVNFYCDTCDRGFKMEEKYHEHCNTHIQCPKEGCSYIAAQKLVNIHIKTQHRSGHAKKIWQIESEDDIKKWIAERKKNFPTKENIARKNEQQKLKLERGEVLENKQFGKMRGGRGRRRGHMNRRNMKRHMSRNVGQKPFAENSENCNLSDNVRAESFQKNDTGTINSSLKMLDRKQEKGPAADPLAVLLKSADPEDEESGEEKEPAARRLQLAGGLGCLANAYGSDMSDSEDQEPSRAAASEKTMDKNGTSSKSSTVHEPASLSSKQEQPRKSGGCLQRSSESNYRQSMRRNKKGESGVMFSKPIDKKLTLLQKLLAPEIRHERNVILQCVRHIVKNNFFDESGKPNISLADGSENMKPSNSNCNSNHSGMYVEESDIWED